MNKLKENKGVSLSAFVITILVILLIVAVLGCVYLYNKGTMGGRVYTVAEEASQDALATIEKIKQQTDNITANVENNGEQKIITPEEKYSDYIKGLKNNLENMKGKIITPDGSKTLDEHIRLLPAVVSSSGLVNAGIEDITISYNGIANIKFKEKSTLAEKYNGNYTINNIVNGGIADYGQDGSTVVWFIYDSGEFIYINFESVGISEIKTQKDTSKFKNIIDVQSKNVGEAYIPVAIDIEGNMIELFK